MAEQILFKNKKVNAKISDILEKIKGQTNLLKDMVDKGEDIVCTCPFHKDGNESKPSCFVFTGKSKLSKLPAGTFHCWSCGESGDIEKFINKCFDEEGSFGREWLFSNFGYTYVDEIDFTDVFELPKEVNTNRTYYNEDYLDEFSYNNSNALNYLINKRHLSKQVIDYFKIGFDRNTNSVTFPIRNVDGKLLGVTKRNISTKKFNIPTNLEKPVYLLDTAKNYNEVYVCESQINALTLWGWGFPAIALFGTGCEQQYNILKKQPINSYVLCFDGDIAGDNGATKFANAMRGVFISKVEIPRGRDVNDLTLGQFENLLKNFSKEII